MRVWRLMAAFVVGCTLSGCHTAPTPPPLVLAEGDTVRIGDRDIVIESSDLMRIRPVDVVGPGNGTILLHGGGAIPSGLLQHFARRAGGMNASIVVVPTANCRADTFDLDSGYLAFLRQYGLENVAIAHTRTPGQMDDVVQLLDQADGVWLAGGGAECLVAPYLGTPFEAALSRVLDRGGVVAGQSAGAVALGSYFETRYEKPRSRVRFAGFDLLQGVTIAAHADRSSQETQRVVDIVRTYPGMLGLCLDEGTFAAIEHDTLTAFGVGRVMIIDARRPTTTLRAEDRFDLATRKQMPR